MSHHIGFYTLLRREVLRFMKVYVQSLLTPIISALLYIIIFGFAIGSRMENVAPVPYVEFIIPGLIMMAIINNAYANTSTSLFISKWQKHIQEVLVSPLSYFEMALAIVLGGVVRGIVVAVGVWITSLFFVPFSLVNPFMFLYYCVMVSLIFSALGIIVGLWSETFDQLSLLSTFVLTPLIFLGGVFHSVNIVPPVLQFITYVNPIFYMVNGLRHSMLGVAEASLILSFGIVTFLGVVFFVVNILLFKKGYKIRS